MKILYLTTVLPGKEKTGGEIATQVFVKALLELGHKLTVVGYQRKDDTTYQVAQHEYRIGQRFIETDRAGLSIVGWLTQAFANNLPYSAAKYYSAHYLNTVRHFLRTTKPELVILEHSQLGWLLPGLSSQLVFIAHNVEHELYAEQVRQGGTVRRWLFNREARLIKLMEDKLARQAKQVWSLTEHDAHYFKQRNPHTVRFPVPSAISPRSVTSTKNCDIGLIGTWTWRANFLGLEWFLKEVHPLVPPQLSVAIAGKGAERLAPFPNNVNYQGFVPDARAFMEQARVVAIPSVSGGGIQIKTLDAIAVGSAIVATSVALRGIEDYPTEIAVADTPQQFATRLVEQLQRPEPKQAFNYWTMQRQQRFKQTLRQALDSFSKQVEVS
jgi:polysaccharide biosynthesis protein PslH